MMDYLRRIDTQITGKMTEIIGKSRLEFIQKASFYNYSYKIKDNLHNISPVSELLIFNDLQNNLTLHRKITQMCIFKVRIVIG